MNKTRFSAQTMMLLLQCYMLIMAPESQLQIFTSDPALQWSHLIVQLILVCCSFHNVIGRLMWSCADLVDIWSLYKSGFGPFVCLWFYRVWGLWCSLTNCLYLACALAHQHRKTVIGSTLCQNSVLSMPWLPVKIWIRLPYKYLQNLPDRL